VSTTATQRQHYVNSTGCRSLIVFSTTSAFWCSRSSKVRHQATFGNSSNLLVKWTAALTCAPLTTAPSSNCALGQNSRNERSVSPAQQAGTHFQLNLDWSSAKIYLQATFLRLYFNLTFLDYIVRLYLYIVYCQTIFVVYCATGHWRTTSASLLLLRYIRRWISLKPLEIEAWFQRTTNRKWPTENQMVTWPMTSSDPERSNSWPQYA